MASDPPEGPPGGAAPRPAPAAPDPAPGGAAPADRAPGGTAPEAPQVEAAPPEPRGPPRRSFLRELGTLIAGALVAGGSSWWTSRREAEGRFQAARVLVLGEVQGHPFLAEEDRRRFLEAAEVAARGGRIPDVDPLGPDPSGAPTRVDPGRAEVTVPAFERSLYLELRGVLAAGGPALRGALARYYEALARAEDYAARARDRAGRAGQGLSADEVLAHRRRVQGFNVRALQALAEAAGRRPEVLRRLGATPGR